MCSRARSPPPAAALPLHLVTLADSLLRRLQDLEQYQVPQLAQCRGPLSFHDELAAAVRAELAGCRRDLEELKLEADDLDRARERAAAAEHVRSIQQRIDSCTKLYRQAVVASKRQIDAYGHLAARDELLAPSPGASGRQSPSPYGASGAASRARSPQGNQSADDALMSATSDVTEGLRRTLQLMQQEVDRSLVSNELLESQTKTMEMTSTQYSTLSSLLHTSRALITALERSALLDRLVLFGAFAFFAAVCAHIFKKRVVDRGVHVLGAVGRVAGAVGRSRSRAGAVAVAEEAGEAVKSEAKGEIARATAAAGALVGAAMRGVQMVRERAFPRAASEEEEQAEDEGVADEFVPRRDGADDERAAAVQPAAPFEEDEEDLPEEFFDAPSEPELESTAPPAATPAAPLDTLSSDEIPNPSAAAPPPVQPTAADSPPSPSPAPAPTPEPAAHLPLEDAPALSEVSDAPPRETVALRGAHPPAPSVDAQEEVEFTAPAPAAGEEHQRDEEEEAEERVFRPLERLRPTRPDLDAQLGDVQAIVDAHSAPAPGAEDVPPAVETPEPEEVLARAADGGEVREEVLLPLVPDLEEQVTLDPAGQSTTAPAPSSLPVADEDAPEPEATAVRLPVDDASLDARTPLGAVAAAEEAHRVAEAHAGEGGTRTPEEGEMREGGLPRVLPAGGEDEAREEEEQREVRLPVDLEKAQSEWTPEAEKGETTGNGPAPPVGEAEEDYAPREEEGEDVEARLDEMLDAQLGSGIAGAYAGMQGAIGGAVPNATALASDETELGAQEETFERPDEVVERAESAASAPSEEQLPPAEDVDEQPSVPADLPSSDDAVLADADRLPIEEDTLAATEDVLPSASPDSPASTAATIPHPTPAHPHTGEYPSATPEPPVSAAPAPAQEQEGAPAAHEEEGVEDVQPTSTGAAQTGGVQEGHPASEAEKEHEEALLEQELPAEIGSADAHDTVTESAASSVAAEEPVDALAGEGVGIVAAQEEVEAPTPAPPADEPVAAVEQVEAAPNLFEEHATGAESDQGVFKASQVHDPRVEERAEDAHEPEEEYDEYDHDEFVYDEPYQHFDEAHAEVEHAAEEHAAEEHASQEPPSEPEVEQPAPVDEEVAPPAQEPPLSAPVANLDPSALDASFDNAAAAAEAPTPASGDIANSDVVFPDPSIDEPLVSTSSAAEDAGVFAGAAEEAVAEHAGEHAPAPGHAADEALHRAEEILDELEHEYEGGFEAYDGEDEPYHEEEEEPYHAEEEEHPPRDEL
ncbi:Protein transport protein sec20 [Rhodotorula kratochvilovae]